MLSGSFSFSSLAYFNNFSAVVSGVVGLGLTSAGDTGDFRLASNPSRFFCSFFLRRISSHSLRLFLSSFWFRLNKKLRGVRPEYLSSSAGGEGSPFFDGDLYVSSFGLFLFFLEKENTALSRALAFLPEPWLPVQVASWPGLHPQTQLHRSLAHFWHSSNPWRHLCPFS
jgi:hypothetical protein